MVWFERFFKHLKFDFFLLFKTGKISKDKILDVKPQKQFFFPELITLNTKNLSLQEIYFCIRF